MVSASALQRLHLPQEIRWWPATIQRAYMLRLTNLPTGKQLVQCACETYICAHRHAEASSAVLLQRWSLYLYAGNTVRGCLTRKQGGEGCQSPLHRYESPLERRTTRRQSLQ